MPWLGSAIREYHGPRDAGDAAIQLAIDEVSDAPQAETNRHRITGMLRLPPEGYRSRLSDYLNAPERSFLSLTDVEIASLDGDAPPQQRPFVALSVAQVVLVMHAEEQPS